MLILTIRTDKSEAEIGLFMGEKQLAYEAWLAHRQLAETIHTKMEKILRSQNKSWRNLEGIICYKGPGSFTGLRIGLSVSNALAGSLGIPVVAESDEQWISSGIKRLLDGQSDKVALPEYGTAVYTTSPKK